MLQFVPCVVLPVGAWLSRQKKSMIWPVMHPAQFNLGQRPAQRLLFNPNRQPPAPPFRLCDRCNNGGSTISLIRCLKLRQPRQQ